MGVGVLAFLTPFILQAQEANDSVKENKLKEIVVKGERAWIEGEKAVFLPTKREKNLAKDPASLVRNMAIPTVIVTGNEIRSIAGTPVTIFINGERADNIDINTFWPKQTKRVEYLENPSDPTFEGASAVLNFVMTDYEAGGVTKIDLEQQFPNSGDYYVASKLAYRRMTFGASFSGEYSREHGDYNSGERTYRDIWYDGEPFPRLTQQYEGAVWERSDNINASVNAKYSDSSKRLTHTLSLNWDHNPGSGNAYEEHWNIPVFNSVTAAYASKSRSLSPQISGNYFFRFNPKWWLWVNWNYDYARNHSSTVSTLEGTPEIKNGNTEDVNRAHLDFSPFFRINDKVTTAVKFQTDFQHYSTLYTGSAQCDQTQWHGTSVASLHLFWRPKSSLSFTLSPQLIMNYWKVDIHERNTTTDPQVKFSVNWNPSRKFSLNLDTYTFVYAPHPWQAGDVLIRRSELMSMEGNPELKTEKIWTPSLYLTWLPSSWLTISAVGSYKNSSNAVVTVYRPGGEANEGLVGKYENAPTAHTLAGDLIMTGRFFDGNLTVTLQPTWRRYIFGGEYAATLSWFRMRGRASWAFGNCEVSAFYGGPEKYFENEGETRMWHTDDWGFSFTYGNGNFYIEAGIKDAFHKKGKSTSQIISPYYEAFNTQRYRGLRGTLEIGYTFGYGKKIDRSIEINSAKSVESAVVGSDRK